MPTEKKQQLVEGLQENLSHCNIAIATDYRGLSVTELNQLRQRLRNQGVEYRVVKNTLTKIAAENVGKTGLFPLLQGPTAIAFGYGDVVQPAKALLEHIRTTRSILSIKGALLDNRTLTPEQVSYLATLPPRETLIPQVVRGIQGPLYSLLYTLQGLQRPIYSLHYLLSARLRELLTVLQARMQQLEKM